MNDNLLHTLKCFRSFVVTFSTGLKGISNKFSKEINMGRNKETQNYAQMLTLQI